MKSALIETISRVTKFEDTVDSIYHIDIEDSTQQEMVEISELIDRMQFKAKFIITNNGMKIYRTDSRW